MDSEREIFGLSGPVHLTKSFDWGNENHRRCIAASLVKGVSVLERDRQQNHQGPNGLAQPWWESFHFHLIQVLVDNEDRSICGAIYEYNQNPSKFVIAFRGTIMELESMSQDLKLDFRVIFDRLHNNSRFHIGLQAVQNIVQINHGVYDIWLAGYSLGFAIALLIGKNMVKLGIHLETYLFNPPFSSLPIEKIKINWLQHKIHHVVLLANMMSTCDNDWTPYLFVNPSDPICSEYIGYFKNIEEIVESGADEIARIVTQNSLPSLFGTAIAKESEPSQHLPSACVHINLSPYKYSKKNRPMVDTLSTRR